MIFDWPNDQVGFLPSKTLKTKVLLEASYKKNCYPVGTSLLMKGFDNVPSGSHTIVTSIGWAPMEAYAAHLFHSGI